MSNAAVYNLLTYDDTNQDKLLFNNAGLLENIKNIKNDNKLLLDKEILDIKDKILKTRSILFKTYDTKEYNSIKKILDTLTESLNTKKSKYNDMIKPSFQDIEKSHFIFLNNHYKPFIETAFYYSKVSVNAKPKFGDDVTFTVPASGNFINDMAIHIRISRLAATDAEDKVRYVNLLGHKIIKKVQFIINNNVIDEYSGEFYNAYYHTCVPESKKRAWLNCMGHEAPIEGILIQDPVYSDYKETRNMYNGFQTIKSYHDPIDLFIPLLFWFNLDKKSALLNNYDQGKVVIKIKLDTEDQLISCIDVKNDIYHERYNSPTIEECELYTNHIFINEDIQDIFISKLGFSLIRTHIYMESILDKNSDTIPLSSSLKFPIEDITFYARPTENMNGIDSLNTWNRNCIMNIINIQTPVIYKRVDNGNIDLGINNIKFYEEYPIFNNVDITINELSTYGADVSLFYQSYIPYISGKNITSNDNNIYYMPFNLYPKEYQPSSYVNMSKSRNIQFIYSSDYIEDHKPVVLYIHATAINFLMYDNKSAILNFSK